MKRAALYLRVSTVDQHPETQLYDLRQMAAQRGYQIVQEYTDRISGVKARRPGLDELMPAAAASTSCWSRRQTESPGRRSISSKYSMS
jgi:DNA invertase Pin-like site-specific DNA recombinase